MDHIVKMDKDLDELMSEVMKIKNRILRKELLEFVASWLESRNYSMTRYLDKC